VFIVIIIIIINVVGLGLYVLPYVIHSLSDDPVLSIFFLGSLYLFLCGVDTAMLVLVSSVFPFSLHVEANFVGSF
jgi:hypothetical protein